MTARPILFSAPMVRALLAGTKTQTRRVFKLPTKGIYERKDMGGWAATTNGGGGSFTIGRDGTRTPAPETVGIWHQTTGKCLNAPYQVGDRLYVREAWRCNGWATDVATIMYRASEGDGYTAMTEQYPVEGKKALCVTGTWHPGLHLPRWASRLTMTVSDVRVQQLQDITEADAVAEGCPVSTIPGTLGHPLCQVGFNEMGTPLFWYRKLWNHLNDERGFGWGANPWVVAVSFSVVGANIDAPAP